MTAETSTRVWQDGSNVEAADAQLKQFEKRGGAFPKDVLDTASDKFVSNFRRILPQHVNMESFASVRPAHWIGKTPMGCLRLMDMGDCPACNFGFEMHRQGDQKGAQDILPSTSAYVNVVKLTKDGALAEEKIYVLRLNKDQFARIKDAFDQYGDITHVREGRNLNIRAKKNSQGDYDVVEFDVKVSEPCPFPGKAPGQPGNLELLDGLYDLSEAIPFYSPQRMIEIMEGRSGGVQIDRGDPMAALPSGGAIEGEIVQDSEVPQTVTRPAGAFGDDDDDTPAAAPAAQAAPQAPKSNPQDAISRLAKRVQSNGNSK